MIALCETRLNDNISTLYRISSYNAFFQNKNTAGGGLAVYLHTKYHGRVLQDISFQVPHIESLFLEVTGAHHFIIGVIYRPPNANIHDFLKAIDDALEVITSRRTLPCYLVGDFNLNLLRCNENYVGDFINLLYSYLLLPTITKPTRVTSISASIIDHIWTNDPKNYQTSDIIYTLVSDHFPVASFTVPVNNTLLHSQVAIKRTTYNNGSVTAFKKYLID